MKIHYSRDNKWYWVAKCKGGITGNYYDQTDSWLGSLLDYIWWVTR